MERTELRMLAAGVMVGLALGFLVGRSFFLGTGAGAGASAPGSAMPEASSAPPGAAPMGGAQAAEAGAAFQEMSALRARVAADPKDREARVRIGNMSFDAGMFEPAIKYYEQALALDGNDPDVLTDLGVAYRNTGNSGKAVELFGKAVELEPAHAQGWFNIAVVKLFDLKDAAGARAALEKLKGVDPSFEGIAELEKGIRAAGA